MMIEFRYLATRSGKSLILSINGKKYIFNLFEGFQRYCIETHFNMNKLTSIFLLSNDSIPAFVGTYLTLRDMGKKDIDVVCGKEYQATIESANEFAHRASLNINYSEMYTDQFVSVRPVENKIQDGDGEYVVETSYILHLNPIRGKFLVDIVPQEIPKHLYTELSKRKTIEYNDVTYDGNKYMEDDISVGIIAIVYSSKNHEELLKSIKDLDLKYIFCFQKDAAEFLVSFFPDAVYLLEDNFSVEYDCFYKARFELNKIHKSFLLPVSRIITTSSVTSKRLMSRDSLVYDKHSRGFSLLAADQQKYLSGNASPTAGTILFLGTGCAVPSKYRNVSSILYESSDSAVMLDCGEDTLFQIHRAYGCFDILQKLKAIFISHSHADHVLGVISVIRNVRCKIKLFGPSSIKAFVGRFGLKNYDFIETDYAKVLERRFFKEFHLFRRGHTFNDNQSLVKAFGRKNFELFFLHLDGEFDVTVCGVEHCSDSCGVRIRDKDMVLTYSGDSKPSILFGAMSFRADIMIHEATFPSEEHERAEMTGHSTLDDAVGVFRDSESKRLLLTHFSQKCKKDPRLIRSGSLVLIYLDTQ